jgi:hypothetical protein
MRKLLLLLSIALSSAFVLAQQELITNGSFTGLGISPWTVMPGSTAQSFFSGGSYCPQAAGNSYVFFGDQFEQAGVDNTAAGIYQAISIPANTTSLSLSFKVSINTLEFNGGFYDYFYVNVLSSNGAFLETLWSTYNGAGVADIPACAPWNEYVVTIPNTYIGQTIRLDFESTTDGSSPTIFRLDDVSVLATLPQSCTYSLSTSSYNCPTAAGGTYPSVANVNTQAGCSWSATVLTGASWLSTTSQGSGSGSLNITVTQNTSSSARTGTISVGGQILTVTQPGGACAFTLSSNNYACANGSAATLNSIATVNTAVGCGWSALVTSGISWLSSSSSGVGNGDVNIVVLQNNTGAMRTGTIDIQGEVITITQPASGVSVEEMNIKNALAFFPNPTQGLLTVENPASEKQGMRISNELGQVIRYEMLGSGKNVIDLTSLSNGVYFIQLGDSKVEKLIVN